MMITSAEFVTSAVRPAQFPPAGLPEFAFAGRSNVGKSSLINTLVSRRKLVQTSSTPGKTRLINFFRVNEALMLVDLPGYGYARVSEEERRRWRPMVEQYIASRESLKAVVVILDFRRTPNAEDGQLLQWLEHRDVPCVLVATKADKLSKTAQRKQLSLIAAGLDTDPDEIIVFSSKSRQGRDALWRVLAEMAAAPPEDERA
ncbi:MAG: ribosome biogenesis GTP-binding protein YihA/YsxC [Desulfobacterales bacterium]|jgi:GTP-binding protein|nr:ribosome biogenesis GTP-binding protein YihA/YsxC [Desulfobacterales bacterium]